MADARFFHKVESLTVADIVRVGEITVADSVNQKRVFHDVAGLDMAGPDDVSWAFIPKVREALKNTKAGAVIVPEKFLSFVPAGCIALVSADPHRSYGLVASAFYPRRVEAYISDKAYIDSTAEIGPGCRIEAGVFIGENVKLGAECDIHPNAVLEAGVQMGDGCTVGANATVSHCIAGNKVYIYPGCHIGQDGFGFAMSPAKGPQKVPQLGRVIIGNDVEIGSSTCVDRGAMGDTVISDGTRIDNLVQVAHNVKLGRCCVMVSQVGIAGSCEFGDFVVAGGQSGFAGHLKIGTGAQIGAQSGVMSEVPPGSILLGAPAVPHKDFMRQVLALKKLTQTKDGQPKFSWKLWFGEKLMKLRKKG